MRTQLPQPPFRSVILFLLPASLLALILIYSVVSRPSQQFSELALGFLHGHLYFPYSIGGVGQDPVLYHGHEYWSEGAFPALTLLPFVALFYAFHLFFYQGYLQWLLVLGVMYFVFALARRLRYNAGDSVVWTFAFVLGSAFAGAAVGSSSWLYAQVVTVFLLLWSLHEYFGRKRWWLIGSLCACIFLTRATAAAVVIFFALELWRGTGTKLRPWRLLPLAVPLAAAVGLQALYNFLRFHSSLDGGYKYQLITPESAASRTFGVFSIRHIPTNLFSLVFGAPNPVPLTGGSWILKFPFISNNNNGMSVFVTSPYFAYLLGQKWAVFSRSARHMLVAATVACLAVLSFYGIGRDQFGYRYSLDFLPELLVVLMLVYRAKHTRLSRGMKFLLLAGGIFNFYLLITFVF